MKFQYRVNGQHLGNASDKDRAIRAARKAALAISDPRGFIHVEILETPNEEDPHEFTIVHRDLVLSESIQLLDTASLDQVGMVVPGQFHVKTEKKKTTDIPLFKVGDHILHVGDLYMITSVTETCARAQPVRKKKIKIKDKLTGKEREFATQQRTVSLAPTADGVLSAEEVEAELKKIKDVENDTSSTRSDGNGGSDDPHSIQQSGETPGDSENGSSVSEPIAELPKRRKVRRK